MNFRVFDIFLSALSACRTSGASKNRDYCSFFLRWFQIFFVMNFLWRIFVMNFDFSEDFLTYNLFTIASFRIGVPSILFVYIFNLLYILLYNNHCRLMMVVTMAMMRKIYSVIFPPQKCWWDCQHYIGQASQNDKVIILGFWYISIYSKNWLNLYNVEHQWWSSPWPWLERYLRSYSHHKNADGIASIRPESQNDEVNILVF